MSRPPVVDRFMMVGQTLEQRFRVDRVVAEGGFGVVYAGRHLNLDVPIAVKVLKVPDDVGEKQRNGFLDSFVQEAKAMARLKHPHIVQVLDTGVSPMASGERAPWMVLEWLEGETLAQFLHRQRRAFSPLEILTLLGPAFDALAFAHEQGIAHRDIKPGNIMLVPGRRGPMAKILDFGIAKVMTEGEGAGSGDTHTVGSFQAYSPRYASPEQLSRARTGPWTDVHALGLIVTEMLVGQSPYRAQDPTELFGEVLSPQRPTPAKFNLDLGPWEGVLARAVAFRQDHRFANAAEFLAALESNAPAGYNPPPGTVGQGTLPPGMVRASTSQPMLGNTNPPTGPQLQWQSQPSYITGSNFAPGPVVPGGIPASGAGTVPPGSHTGPGGMPGWSQSQSQPMPGVMHGNTFTGGVAVTGAPAPRPAGARLAIIALSSFIAAGGIIALIFVMMSQSHHTAAVPPAGPTATAAPTPVAPPPAVATTPPAAPVPTPPPPANPPPVEGTSGEQPAGASTGTHGESGTRRSTHGSARGGHRGAGGHSGGSSPGLW